MADEQWTDTDTCPKCWQEYNRILSYDKDENFYIRWCGKECPECTFPNGLRIVYD